MKRFFVAQAKSLMVGIGTMFIWATCDWLATKHGWPMGRDRDYADCLFAATAGAAAVYMFQNEKGRL